MSDVPIRVSRRLRAKLLEAQKYKSPLEFLKILKGFKFADLKPELPAIAEFSTGDTMGASCDKLAAMFGISREDQDAFAISSHKRAAAAWESGYYNDEVIALQPEPGREMVHHDNGVRGDSSPEKLAKLRAGLREALRHGYGGQCFLPHRRRLRGPGDVAGQSEGAGPEAESHHQRLHFLFRRIRSMSCCWVRPMLRPAFWSATGSAPTTSVCSSFTKHLRGRFSQTCGRSPQTAS